MLVRVHAFAYGMVCIIRVDRHMLFDIPFLYIIWKIVKLGFYNPIINIIKTALEVYDVSDSLALDGEMSFL